MEIYQQKQSIGLSQNVFRSGTVAWHIDDLLSASSKFQYSKSLLLNLYMLYINLYLHVLPTFMYTYLYPYSSYQQ